MDLPMVLKAMGDATRWRILELLHDRGEMCVCELLDRIEGTQSNLSTHLGLLHRAGLVGREKVGKFVFYSLDSALAGQVLARMQAALEPATVGSARPAGAIYAACCGGQVPVSRAKAEQAAECCRKVD